MGYFSYVLLFIVIAVSFDFQVAAAASVGGGRLKCYRDCRSHLKDCIYREDITFDEFVECHAVSWKCIDSCYTKHGIQVVGDVPGERGEGFKGDAVSRGYQAVRARPTELPGLVRRGQIRD